MICAITKNANAKIKSDGRTGHLGNVQWAGIAYKSRVFSVIYQTVVPPMNY